MMYLLEKIVHKLLGKILLSDVVPNLEVINKVRICKLPDTPDKFYWTLNILRCLSKMPSSFKNVYIQRLINTH